MKPNTGFWLAPIEAGMAMLDAGERAIHRRPVQRAEAAWWAMRDAAMKDYPASTFSAAPAVTPLLLAARAVMAIRPTNWDDADDPHQVAAWTALQAALAPAGEDDLGCGICTLGFVEGEPCLTDVELGPVHATCCGPERESYVGPDGEPLKEGQPIPTPWTWSESGRPVVNLTLADLSEGSRAALLSEISRELQQHDEFHGKPAEADEQARHILQKAGGHV